MEAEQTEAEQTDAAPPLGTDRTELDGVSEGVGDWKMKMSTTPILQIGSGARVKSRPMPPPPPTAALFPNDRSDRVEARRSLPRHLDKDEDVRVPGISSPRVRSIKENPFLGRPVVSLSDGMSHDIMHHENHSP